MGQVGVVTSLADTHVRGLLLHLIGYPYLITTYTISSTRSGIGLFVAEGLSAGKTQSLVTAHSRRQNRSEESQAEFELKQRPHHIFPPDFGTPPLENLADS
jgi:hypothetical protein